MELITGFTVIVEGTSFGLAEGRMVVVVLVVVRVVVVVMVVVVVVGLSM